MTDYEIKTVFTNGFYVKDMSSFDTGTRHMY